ncbi:uncharacterized protein LOC116298223 [Actinia tenebrosa]|uniref:Uncharacterized protein LOC116298223 n=1 Tax=Actinia tenebrosa TaxID=6105 RepID=A0A6P8IAZ7_ACTTE|nr:uncharacterized protein LOC116298223 [Actinia tenebrosa]
MALFRCQALKQRFLVPKLSSAVVYYVHSHLQYTPTISQALQKFDLPGNELCRYQAPQTLTNKPHVISKNTAENEHADGLKNILQGNEIISESQMPSNLVTSLRLDPFISQTQLALLSLCYDTHKNFRATYRKSLDQKTLKPPQNIKLSSLSNLSHNNCYDKSKKGSGGTVYKVYGQESMQKESRALNTVLYMNSYKDLCNKTDTVKKNKQDKCDPLHLAIVFDFLREEIPLFFTKGHGYELYHNNVTFVNGLLGMTFRGLKAYKMSIASMRITCQMLMTDATMEILKITKDSKDCNIKVRWRVSGVPRFSMFRSRAKQDINNKRYVDGFSVFEVGVDGLIHCHRLLKLMPSHSGQLDNPLWALNSAAVISLLRQEKTFEMFARQRVEDIEDTIPLFGAS